jgi:CO/xanthine dehydrogenase Mo-binding subunit
LPTAGPGSIFATPMTQRSVGRNVPRKDGADKTSGAARYVDDLRFPGMLFGRTVRSTVPHGRVRSVRVVDAPPGLVVVDHRDIPGKNVCALIEDDQPMLAAGEVRHAAEPIVLLAHEDRAALAAVRVEIDFEPLPALFDPLASTTVLKAITIDKGDVESALSSADVVVVGEYRTGHQEHVYIEPNGVIAVPENGGVTIHGSLQCPYYVHKAMKTLLRMSDAQVRIVQAETGGGFGGKEEYPSLIAGHAALLALKAGRPVKIVYDRVEDMVATTKRHPSVVRHRTGLTRDGRLVAMDVEVILDGGAYVTLSPVVLSRGCIHAAGPYRCDNVRIAGRAVMTNTPPNGAFRGFGAPQTQFAMEVHMERIAEALAMDPVALRERNALRPGDTTATGQVMREDCSALEVLRRAVERSDYRRKRREYAGTGRGIGLALFFHGSGFTGSGEVYLASRAALELADGGAVNVLVGSTEIGQGTRTMHAQIVADALGVPYERVNYVQPDTARVPDSGPTVASRTCMVVGKILQRCAEEMKATIGDADPAEWVRQHGPLVVTKEYERPTDVVWDDLTYRGDAYAAYGWACDVAEVELDPDTFEARPVRITAVQDVGRAIHPMLVAGQIEGGTAQGVGMALIEHVVMRDGAMANANLTNYTIPTTLDTPRMDVEIVESGGVHGPWGAKGIGEMPIDGAPPAVVNAIRHAGLDARAIPAVPEYLMTLPACASH